MKPSIHPTAIVEAGADIREDVKVWHFAHIRSGATLGVGVSVGKDVYIDSDVNIGEGTRIQNGVNIYKGVQIGRWCFIGPSVVFTNDQHPRVGRSDWRIVPTVLEDGCSLGAGVIVRCGVTIGTFAMVGAGGVVTKDVPEFCLASGVPSELTNRICACGETLLPLLSRLEDLIRPCCVRQLDPGPLGAAKARVKELGRHPASS